MQAIANDGYNGYNEIHIQAEIKKGFTGSSVVRTRLPYIYIYIYIVYLRGSTKPSILLNS